MAQGRILSRKISYSKDAARLIDKHGPYAGLFFTWLIAHLDRDGRIYGDPAVLKGIVIPLINECTVELIEESIRFLERSKVAQRYSIDGQSVLWLPKFRLNQPNLRYDREPESNFPDPPQRLIKKWARLLGVRLTDASRPEDHSGGTVKSKSKRRKTAPDKAETDSATNGTDQEFCRQAAGNVQANDRQPAGDVPADNRQPAGLREGKRREVEEKDIREEKDRREGPNDTPQDADQDPDSAGDPLSRARASLFRCYPALRDEDRVVRQLAECVTKYSPIVDVANCIEDAHAYQKRKEKTYKDTWRFVRNWIKREAGDDPHSKRYATGPAETPPSDLQGYFEQMSAKVREQSKE